MFMKSSREENGSAIFRYEYQIIPRIFTDVHVTVSARKEF